MLKVVCGPFPALEDAFAARVAELRPGPGAPPLLVVAPSRRLADRLQRLLVVERGLALAGVHFHTFHSLAAALLEDEELPGDLLSDPDFHDAVVEGLLDAAPEVAGPSERRPAALAAAARSSLRDLMDAGVEPAAAAGLLAEGLLRDTVEASRLAALLGLQAAYESKLASLGVLPPSALTRLATEAAPRSAFLAGFREALYYGFYDLTGRQLAFFEAVCSAAPVRLYFPYRRGRPAYKFAEGFYELALAASGPEHLDAPASSRALGPALDALFDPGAPPAAPAGRVEVVSASGARDEAWAAAKACADWGASGLAWEDMAVSARSLEPYRAALAEAFAAEGIPLDLEAEEPVLRQPLARAALDLLSLRRRDFPAALLDELAASPYFRAAPPARAALWRRLIAGLGIRSGWLQWRGKLESRSGGPIELQPRQVADGRPGFLVPAADAGALWSYVSGLRERLDDPPAPWSERARSARALLGESLGLPAQPLAAEADAWEAVHGALDALAAFDRLGRPCAWDEFLDAFERKLSRASRSAGSGRRGVRALDAMDLRGQRCRGLALLGLQEGLFPRRVGEDPLLSDAARAALRHPGGWWIATKGTGHEEERLLFALAAGSAAESLTLVFPRSDEDGKPRVPSTYLRELCRAAGLPPPAEGARRVPRPPAARLASCPPELLTPREAALLAALTGGSAAAALAAAGAEAPGLADLEDAAAALADRDAPAGPRDGLTRPVAAEAAGWRREGLSPTALDTLAACPFRFFAGRVLGLPEPEEPSGRGELDPATRGRLYHSVLERARTQGVEAALAGVFAENDWRALGLYPLLWEALREEMGAHVRAFADWDARRLASLGLSPLASEKKLEGAPPEGAPAGVPWRGTVDRVEADEKTRRFRVTDFKTKASARWKDPARKAEEGESHQLPVYAELAARWLGEGWSFDGASLLFVESAEEREQSIAPEQWKELRAAFFERVARRLESAADGRFPIRPDTREMGHCAHCGFAAACRKTHGPSVARAARLPRP